MKKISLLLIASLFSLGVIAQTTPTPASKSVDPKMTPAQPAQSSAAVSGKENKDSKVAPASLTGAQKNNIKKTGANKKATHHVTPVKKTNPAAQKTTTKEDLKK